MIFSLWLFYFKKQNLRYINLKLRRILHTFGKCKYFNDFENDKDQYILIYTFQVYWIFIMISESGFELFLDDWNEILSQALFA